MFLLNILFSSLLELAIERAYYDDLDAGGEIMSRMSWVFILFLVEKKPERTNKKTGVKGSRISQHSSYFICIHSNPWSWWWPLTRHSRPSPIAKSAVRDERPLHETWFLMRHNLIHFNQKKYGNPNVKDNNVVNNTSTNDKCTQFQRCGERDWRVVGEEIPKEGREMERGRRAGIGERESQRRDQRGARNLGEANNELCPPRVLEVSRASLSIDANIHLPLDPSPSVTNSVSDSSSVTAVLTSFPTLISPVRLSLVIRTNQQPLYAPCHQESTHVSRYQWVKFG